MTTYQQVLEELRHRSQQAYEQGDLERWEAIGHDADELNVWLAQDQPGPCPVDLGGYDIEVQIAGTPPPDDGAILDEAKMETEESAENEAPLADMEEAFQHAFGDIAITDTSDEEGRQTPLESPEQAGLRRGLEDARRYFEGDQLREALALSAEIATRAQAPDVKEAAADLRDRARGELNIRLNKALADGDAAREAGDEELARQQYQLAQELDPDNAHARRALLELNGADFGLQLFHAEEQRLRIGLKEKRDIKKLGEAVYLAEVWDAEDKLGDELAALLKEARQYYDDLRTQMGQETTMARFGDLEARRKAWEKARERLSQGFKYTFDTVLKKEIETTEYIDIADRLLEERSAETAQYEIEIISRSLPAHPQVALQRLDTALQKPFHPHHLQILEEKQQEVKALAESQKQAKALLDEARASDDPVTILSLVQQAYDVFQHAPGLATRRAQARQTALGTLVTQIETHHRQADTWLRMDTANSYEQARAEIAQAGEIAARWPEEEKPPRLVGLLEEGEKWAEKIAARQVLRAEFEKRVKEVREQIADPARRERGKQQFEKLRNDPRFADFPEFEELTFEVASGGELSEQLAAAQAARMRGEWPLVYRLAADMQSGGKAGQFEADVNALYAEAALELDIVRAQQYLRNNDVLEANTILSRIIEKPAAGTSREELQERLKKETAEIRECIQQTGPMQELFDRALGVLELLGSPGVRTFLVHPLDWNQSAEAISGLAQPDLAKLAIALKGKKIAELTIQDARDGAHKTLLDELKNKSPKNRIRALRIFRYVHGIPLADLQENDPQEADEGAENTWEPYRLSLRTTDAGKMSRLLAESLRKDVLETLLVAFKKANPPSSTEGDGKGEQTRQEKSDISDSKVRILAERAALLRQANLLDLESEREAARWFEVEHGSRLAATREKLGDWQGAADIWDKLNRSHPGEKRVQEGLSKARGKQSAIQTTLNSVELALSNGQRRHALQTLHDALFSENTKDSSSLQTRYEEVFSQMRTELIGIADIEGRKNDTASISRAVIALLELKEIEAIKNPNETEHESVKKLDELTERIENTHPELTHNLPNLAKLYSILQEADALQIGPAQPKEEKDTETAGKASKWDQAIRANNFQTLEAYWTQIEELGMETNPLAAAFRERLDEWEEVHRILSHDIATAKHSFSGKEDFEEVVILLRGNTVRPPHRPDPQKKDWLHVQQEDYDHIRDLMNDEMTVTDPYRPATDNKITGWGAVEEAAAQRADELSRWEAWHNESARLMVVAEDAHNAAQQSHNERLSSQQEAWENACERSVHAHAVLLTGPRAPSNGPVAVRSQKAKNFSNAGDARKYHTQSWVEDSLSKLLEIIGDISDLGGYSTPEEFRRAAARAGNRDCTDLQRLIDRANAIGPGSSILSPGEFNIAASRAAQGDFAPARQLLKFTDLLRLDDFPTAQEFDDAVAEAKADGDARQRLVSLLTRMGGIPPLLSVFRTAKDQAGGGNFEPIKGFLQYSAQIRASRKNDEQDRLRVYARVMEQCQARQPSFFDRIRDLFGW